MIISSPYHRHLSKTYENLYRESMDHPEQFWTEQSRIIDWIKPFDRVRDAHFSKNIDIRWFLNGKLNVSANCVDRHLENRADRVALLWEPDDPSKPSRKITYRELHREVCRVSNALKSLGVKKGDRVTIYMPMIPEAAFAMLACTRIGAVHSVVFGGFSAEALSDRITDCDSTVVVTADAGFRAGKRVELKSQVDEALRKCPSVNRVLVFKHAHSAVQWVRGRDVWFSELTLSDECPVEAMDAEDPLFILYTSGSTNKPKGVLHTTGGYLVYAAFTHKMIFDIRDDDIYWCTADVGWVTGHSYMIYGPLANGVTSLMFEGVPTYPSPSRFWETIDKHQVNIFYTAPTALRALMREGDLAVRKTSRKSLRVLGSVGEPINPEAWLWYYRVVGEERCPVIDTWWQTETGGIMISPIAGVTDLKPGSATLPFFGVEPVLVDGEGKRMEGPGSGYLCIAGSWPGQMRTVYKDHERFKSTYFSQYPGLYFTGDGCRRDEDGYYWITGRVDDVINVSGHRLGTAEIESALVAHQSVSEAAVVGFPHDIKGQGIYAFVTLKSGIEPSDQLSRELIQWVRSEISPIASPDVIQWAPQLPKTRSGKIMRRILRKIVEQDTENLGDTSTLADPSVVSHLIRESKTLLGVRR